MKTTVLVEGFYGRNNLGDDFILRAILDTIHKSETIKFVKIMVSDTHYAGYNELFRMYPRLHFTLVSNTGNSIKQIFERIRILQSIDYWIIGGGGVFPKEKIASLIKRLLYIRIARIKNVKTAMYGIEINPVYKKRNKYIWKQIIANCDFIYTRNQSSMNFLNSVYVKKNKAYSDVTFGVCTQEEIEFNEISLNQKLAVSPKSFYLWSLAMPWTSKELDGNHYKNRYDSFVSQIADVINTHDKVTHVFLPFYYDNDIVFINDITKKISESIKYIICDHKKSLKLGEKRKLFFYADRCICMRYHSVLFALYYAKQVYAISYSPKTTSMLKEIGLVNSYVEFGIRPTEFFYSEFDLDKERFIEILENKKMMHLMN